MGAVTPLGVGARQLFRGWVAGDSGIEDGLGRCSDFDPSAVLTRKELRRSDRFTQLALAACEEAMTGAGWGSNLPYPAERIGCVLGTGIGGLPIIEREYDVLQQRGSGSVSAIGVPMMMANASSGVVAMRYGLCGTNFGIVSACAASAHAIGAAVRLIQCGDADAVVTGGSESALTPLTMASFAKMGATSPSGISRPFDIRRDGFVMGEGSGVLVLEDAESARRRAAPVLGRILGFAATSDAFHLTAPEPTGRGAANAIIGALRDAGVSGDEIDYVNAHGTSTPLNDRSETQAIKAALGSAARRVPVSATKSVTGHLLGASGAVEAVATIWALRARVAPPTVGWEEAEPGLDLDYVPERARALPERDDDPRPAIGLSNSFGFGGHNAALVLEAA
jgi:3-oxoacyl-[acyl-carrier-protein] synthase II